MPQTPPLLQVALDLLSILCLSTLISSMVWAMVERPISPTDSPYFVSGLTAAGTVVAGFISQRVQNGFLRALETPLRQSEEILLSTQASQRRLSLNNKWRSVLRVSSFKERLSHPIINLAYLLCALVTTATVTIFTPELGQQTVSYNPLVPGRDYPEIEASRHCGGVTTMGDLPEDWDFMEWPLENGNKVWIRYTGSHSDDCPPELVVHMASGIQNGNRSDYAYVDSGVAIHRSAIGASIHLFRGEEPQKFVRDYGRFVKSTRQCVPVLAKNPVLCSKSNGTLLRNGEQGLSLDLNPDYPLTKNATYAWKISTTSNMLNWAWPALKNNDHESPGRGVVAYSARNGPEIDKPSFANTLARAMGDRDAETLKAGDTYIVSCLIDASPSFEHREVTLDFQVGSTENFNLGYTRLLKGGNECKPKHESVGYLHFASAFSAQYRFWIEQTGSDGYFSLVDRIVTNRHHKSFAFNNSRNELEDALGIIAAMGVSVIDLDNGPVNASFLDRPAEAIITVFRLGKHNKLAYIWILPLAILLVLICYNTVMSWSVRRQPGAGLFNGKRPELYAAESMIELRKLRGPLDLQTEEHSLVERPC